jgi:hypothetical protein
MGEPDLMSPVIVGTKFFACAAAVWHLVSTVLDGADAVKLRLLRAWCQFTEACARGRKERWGKWSGARGGEEGKWSRSVRSAREGEEGDEGPSPTRPSRQTRAQ